MIFFSTTTKVKYKKKEREKYESQYCIRKYINHENSQDKTIKNNRNKNKPNDKTNAKKTKKNVTKETNVIFGNEIK